MDIKSLKEIERAMVYAVEKHGDQKYGSKPYLYHLTQVVGLLNEYGYGENPLIMSAAWLHDVLEDTQSSYRDLEVEFGLPIAYTVWTVTSETMPANLGKSEKANNRMARLQSTVPKLRSSREGLIVKLADRIANTKESRLDNPKLFAAYQRENLFFQECFYRPKINPDINPSLNDMWLKLISLSQPVEA